jgi:hypothetical protein
VYLDIRLLQQMHPALPDATSAAYCHRAALAFGRCGHEPPRLGVDLTFEGELRKADIDWDQAPHSDTETLDRNRITEDGAEAVALIWVAVDRRWIAVRKLQRGEFADWLLRDGDDLVALEISGIDGLPESGRLNKKRRQAARCATPGTCARYACVVAFGPPTAVLRTA